MTLKAVVFGGMGTLAECAEMDRAAWNAAFRVHDVAWEWSWDTYAELLRQGGDRQLAARYAAHMGEIVDAVTLDRTHQRLFAARLAGPVPLRPGVARVMTWAARAGLKLALVSRSDTGPVGALLQATARERGGLHFDTAILRGDVAHVVPDPEPMRAALAALEVAAQDCVVVADTAVSVQAAQAAGLPVLAYPGQLARHDPDPFDHVPVAHFLSPEALAGAWAASEQTAAE